MTPIILAAMVAASPQTPATIASGTLTITTSTQSEQREWEHKYNTRNRELAQAMTSRVLTDGELAEVLGRGKYLLVTSGGMFYDDEVSERFDRMMEIQTRLRMYSEHLERMEKKCGK